ncbi:7715_t:CDS:2 [Gigaspora margarita]|uniref:7715_t:CDS:1 n=1 Tax=Gigaspora margarita TaxID=4874 RepID=A0ABN7VE91_GIGMA|nr:7715_t:CDS:2 [Gigaspora margarita]
MSKGWTNVTPSGIEPSKLKSISCAKFNNESKISIFGGWPPTNDDSYDYLWIFDTLKKTWSVSNSSFDIIGPRWGYSAVALPDGVLYIGGVYSTLYMPMNALPFYNTTSDSWIVVVLGHPPPREEFSAVLTSDGRIIIYGGMKETEVYSDLWVLYMSKVNAPLLWVNETERISNPINLKLVEHTATLVDNYMLVAFGVIQDGNISHKRDPIITNHTYSISSSIFLLDVSQQDSYKWVTEFTPTK